MFKNSKSCFGLDISDEMLKFVELMPSKSGIKIGRYGERQIPFGIIKNGEIKEIKEFEKILSILKKEEKIKSARVSLSKIGSIPFPVFQSYLSVFKNSKIPILSFEYEWEAIIRTLFKKNDVGTYMIIDIGKKFTGIYIISRSAVMFSSLFPVGGHMFTKMIEKKLKTSFKEAENIKIKYGLDHNFFDEKTFSLFLDGLSILQDEISRRFLYWNTHKNEKNDRPRIEKIILCGGGSNLTGLSEHISVNMKTQVELADVWTNILDIKKNIPEISFEKSLSFAPALGLALKNFKKNR